MTLLKQQIKKGKSKTKKMKYLFYILFFCIIAPNAFAEGMVFNFKSPVFNGIGFSAHALTIENQEFSRKAAIKEKEAGALRQEIRDAGNTNYAKFIKNIESRIYAQLSKNLTDSLFGESCGTTYDGLGVVVPPTDKVGQGDTVGVGSCSGTVTFEGTTISYEKNTTTDVVTLTIDGADGKSTITVPLNDFQF